MVRGWASTGRGQVHEVGLFRVWSLLAQAKPPVTHTFLMRMLFGIGHLKTRQVFGLQPNRKRRPSERRCGHWTNPP